MGWKVSLLLALLAIEGSAPNHWGPANKRDGSSWGSLRTWLSGSHSQVGVAENGPWVSSGGLARARSFTPLKPVTVQCQEVNMVVTVQRDLFGTGKLIQAADLRLGAAFCTYTSTNGDMVTFQIALQDCGNTLQVTPDFLVYSSILVYNPSRSSSTITRTNPASVLVQCIYPRNGNVSSKAIKPTWIPFSSTVYAEESLAFSLRLMNDDWKSQRTSTIFQLGDIFHMEASVQAESHAAMRIFVDSCVATLSPDKGSSPRYDLITARGCLVDGKISDSTFISPRLQQDKLQFTFDAFRFIADPRSMLYITCALKVAPANSAPDPTNKACSFDKGSNSWVPVEGPSSICSCCDAANCDLAGGSRGLYSFRLPRRFEKRGDESFELEEIAIGPLVVLDEPASPAADGLHANILDDEPEASRSVLESQAGYSEPVVQEEQNLPTDDGNQNSQSESKEPRKMLELQPVLLEPLVVLEAIAREDHDLHETLTKEEPRMQQFQMGHLPPVLDEPIPIGKGHPNLMVAQGGEPLRMDFEVEGLKLVTVQDRKDRSEEDFPLGVVQDQPQVESKDTRTVLGSHVVNVGPVLVLDQEHHPVSEEFQFINVGPIVAESLLVGEEPTNVLGSQSVHVGPVVLNDRYPVLEEPRQMLQLLVDPIVMDETYPLAEQNPTTSIRTSKARRMLDPSHKVHVQLVVVLDGAQNHTDGLEAPEWSLIPESESSVHAGPAGLLAQTQHPVSDKPQLEAQRVWMESQALHSGPLVLDREHGSGDIPHTELLKSQQGAHAPSMPPSPSVSLPPLVLREELRPISEGELQRELIEEVSKSERYERVESVLLIVAGIVLACMVVLGGFLVYRRRAQSV